MKESQEHVEVVSLQPSPGRNQAKGVMMNESISPSKRMTWIPLSSPPLASSLHRQVGQHFSTASLLAEDRPSFR